MPSAWAHAVIDLITYGRPYFELHKDKDKPSETLGWNHREIGHEWYQAFGKKWSLDEPFPTSLKEQILKVKVINDPNKAEEQMAHTNHDYIDRIWDGLSDKERRYREGFFIWVLLSPKILKEWAGVDVLKGKIQRVIDGREVWESCPELKSEYKRLRNYVEAVKEKNKILQGVLERYGQE